MIIYLASPYSHELEAVRIQRYCWVCSFACRLIATGHVVFSPIAHSHPIATCGMPIANANNSEFWLKQSLPWMKAADCLGIVTMPGWEESSGIKAEIAEARELGKKVFLIDHASLEMKEMVE